VYSGPFFACLNFHLGSVIFGDEVIYITHMQNDEIIYISLNLLLHHPVAHPLHGETVKNSWHKQNKSVLCATVGLFLFVCFQLWVVKCILGLPLEAKHSALTAIQLNQMLI